jgi:membrane-bound lytic murein transglycosylase C
MAARKRDKRVYLLLALLLLFLSPALRVASEEPPGPVGRLAQQGSTWQGEWQDVDEDRWTEESERINGLGFDVEENWRSKEYEGSLQGHPVEEEPRRIRELRKEGEDRQQADREAWERRAEKIRMVWGTVRESSPTVYVEYAENNKSFGGVDYEKGFLEVGAIAPVFHMDAPLRIDRMLSERLAFLLQLESMSGVPDLQGQVAMPGTGRVVTQDEVEAFSRYAVRSGEPVQRYVAPDGVRRLRREIRIEFVPDHLQTRVRRVLPHVQRAARIYEVAPELILAVIQTESVFNPRAVSNAGAVGLMQLVPSSGALDASKLVYGEARLLTREELSRPDKNIELGAAYLRILLRRYFGEHSKDPEKLLFLAIASYNCGPRRVKIALGDQNLESLSSTELYDLLIRVVPPETQVYLQRVVQNMKQYRSIMGRSPLIRLLLAGFTKPYPVDL